MSRFLMFVCLTLGLVITGCGGEKDKDKAKEQKTTKDDEKGSAAKGSTGKETKKEETKKEETKKAEDKGSAKKAEKKETEKKEDKNASVDNGGEDLVSLKLPNMT